MKGESVIIDTVLQIAEIREGVERERYYIEIR